MVHQGERIRIVLDANVLFSGCVFNSGYPYQILELIAKHEICLVINEYILSEVREQFKKKDKPESIKWLNTFLANALIEKVEIPSQRQVQTNLALVPRDSKDVPIVLTALNSKADYLVSGDKDLNSHDQTTIKIDSTISVLTPKEFIEKVVHQH